MQSENRGHPHERRPVLTNNKGGQVTVVSPLLF